MSWVEVGDVSDGWVEFTDENGRAYLPVLQVPLMAEAAVESDDGRAKWGTRWFDREVLVFLRDTLVRRGLAAAGVAS